MTGFAVETVDIAFNIAFDIAFDSAAVASPDGLAAIDLMIRLMARLYHPNVSVLYV